LEYDHISGSEPLPDLEETCDSSEVETENKECVGAHRESVPVEESTDAFMEVTTLEIADMEPDNVSVDVTDQDVTDCKTNDQVSNKGDDQEDINNDQDVMNGDLEIVELIDENISHEGDDKEDTKNEPEKEDGSNDQGSFMLFLIIVNYGG